MKIAEVKVDGVCARAWHCTPITSGMVGATVSFELSEEWNGLHIACVFRAGKVTRNAEIFDTTGTVIPHECLAEHGYRLSVGLQGVDVAGTIVIPTIWAGLGNVLPGADLSEDPNAAPTLPPWAVLREDIGEPEDLQTPDKSSIVAAINSLKQNAGSGTVKSVNGVAPDEDGNVELDIETAVLDAMISLNVAPVLLDNGAVLTDSDGAILLNM